MYLAHKTLLDSLDDSISSVYIVKSGLYISTDSMKTSDCAYGFTSLFSDDPIDHTVTCVREGDMLVLSREDFQWIIISAYDRYFDTLPAFDLFYSPGLAPIYPSTRRHIIKYFEYCEFKSGDILLDSSLSIPYLYIIINGVVRTDTCNVLKPYETIFGHRVRRGHFLGVLYLASKYAFACSWNSIEFQMVACLPLVVWMFIVFPRRSICLNYRSFTQSASTTALCFNFSEFQFSTTWATSYWSSWFVLVWSRVWEQAKSSIDVVILQTISILFSLVPLWATMYPERRTNHVSLDFCIQAIISVKERYWITIPVELRSQFWILAFYWRSQGNSLRSIWRVVVKLWKRIICRNPFVMKCLKRTLFLFNWFVRTKLLKWGLCSTH